MLDRRYKFVKWLGGNPTAIKLLVIIIEPPEQIV